MFYKDLELRKEKVRNFIKENQKTTSREIKSKLHTKIEKVYKNGMKEAFEDAGVKFPRNFNIKTKEEKIEIIIEFLKKNPLAGGQKIRKETKINFLSLFKNTPDAFKRANVKYLRKIDKRTPKQKKVEIIKLVKKNPLISVTELSKKTKTKPYNYFKNIEEIYRKAKIEKIQGSKKRTIKLQKKIIEYIKKNNLATQREINKNCNTHVQDLFKGGIFEAYKKAGVKFPYERLKLYGTALKEIKNRAKSFEEKMSLKLSGYGKVNRLVKTKRGIADIIFERKNKKSVIEIKDYRHKDISISQIKQLNKYLEDTNSNLGFLICPKKPRKDKFLIGKNKIFVIEEAGINTIPKIIDKGA